MPNVRRYTQYVYLSDRECDCFEIKHGFYLYTPYFVPGSLLYGNRSIMHFCPFHLIGTASSFMTPFKYLNAIRLLLFLLSHGEDYMMP